MPPLLLYRYLNGIEVENLRFSPFEFVFILSPFPRKTLSNDKNACVFSKTPRIWLDTKSGCGVFWTPRIWLDTKIRVWRLLDGGGSRSKNLA